MRHEEQTETDRNNPLQMSAAVRYVKNIDNDRVH